MISMISRVGSAVSTAVLVLFVTASNALAATGGSDPTKVGDNIKGIVSPNVKAIWWVALVVGLLYMAIARKGSRAGGVGVILLLSGIVIWNPGGVTSFMQGISDKVV